MLMLLYLVAGAVMNLCRRMEEAVSRLEHGTLAERIAIGFHVQDLPTYPTGNFCVDYFNVYFVNHK